MKSLLYSFAIIGITLTPTSLNDALKKDLPASVLIRRKILNVDMKTLKVEKEMIGCFGTYISKDIIITAAHCFSEPITINTWARGPYNDTGYPVKLIYIDTKKDLALLKAPYKHPYVKLGPLPHRGDKVMALGSPMIFEFVPSEGIVGMVSLPLNEFSGNYIIHTAMINRGSSGGGLFNEKGQLIGVNTLVFGFFGWTGLSASVNAETIKVFLQDSEFITKLYED